MNKFEISCLKFKERFGHNTPKQIQILEQIKIEKSRPRPRRNYGGFSTGYSQLDFDLSLCGQD